MKSVTLSPRLIQGSYMALMKDKGRGLEVVALMKDKGRGLEVD